MSQVTAKKSTSVARARAAGSAGLAGLAGGRAKDKANGNADALSPLPFMELPQRSRKPGAPVRDATPPIGAEIRETHLLFRKLMHEKLRTRHVTAAQWAFLRILWNEDGLNQKDLAERVGVHQTTTVPAIAILERNGYVKRVRSTEDRRNVMIFVTDAGRHLAHELIPYATASNRRALEGFARDEIDTLMALLLRVQQNLRPTER
jgi:DNA-binding MarR family transcriptional regulator